MLNTALIVRAVSRSLAAFRRDRRGVSALEFALIAPVMISMYIGTGVLCEAMMAQRRVSHISSAVGDLVGQQTALANGYVTSAFTAGTVIMAPFPTTPLQLRVTSITQASNGKATVDWSCGQALTAYSTGTVITTLPTGLLINAGDNVLMSEAKYAYTPPANFFLPSALNFSDTFYLEPRGGSTLAKPGTC